MPDPTTIPPDVHAIAEQLAQLRQMRRGSLTERLVKCNKPGCACVDRPDARHGPYYSVSRVVKGKTQSRWLDADQAKTVQRQLEAGQQFRGLVEATWGACERWADAELDGLATPPEDGEKGGSRRSSRRRS